MGFFYVYNTFFKETPLVVVPELTYVDKEFKNIITDKRTEIEEKEIEYADYKNIACLADGQEWEHGTVKTFYSRISISVHEKCSNFSLKRRCDDGFWLGNKKFTYSKCVRTVECRIDAETTIKNGEEIELYSRNVVPYGDNCERYKGKRTCVETILTGNSIFKYKECRVSKEGVCRGADPLGREYTIPNNRSHIFFSKSEVPHYDSCSNYSENRICSNGNLFGDKKYEFWACQKLKPAGCYLGGVKVGHGQARIFYSKSSAENNKTCSFFAQVRECDNGDLSGQKEYSNSFCLE